MRGEKDGFFIMKQIKKPQEVRRNTRLRLVFPPTLLLCYRRFLRALQQSTVEASLFVD